MFMRVEKAGERWTARLVVLTTFKRDDIAVWVDVDMKIRGERWLQQHR